MIYKILFVFMLVLAGFSPLNAQKPNQKIQVSGTVTDANGQPIKRAIIYVDSIKTFNRTNKKGLFKVKLSPDTKHFMVYAPKHGMFSILYDGRTSLNVQFEDKGTNITETDLKAMGFTIVAPRKGTIDPSRFKDYTSIFVLIREMFTGVEVKGERIVVRGASSFSTNDSPLYIVDGSYVSNIAFVNPIEVNSIELIKDGNASLYGARGANGVFVITLKK